jgi:hypothetical protein
MQMTTLLFNNLIIGDFIMTIHKKDDGLFCLTMKESELDQLHTAIGGIKHLSTWAAMIEQVYETYYR